MTPFRNKPPARLQQKRIIWNRFHISISPQGFPLILFFFSQRLPGTWPTRTTPPWAACLADQATHCWKTKKTHLPNPELWFGRFQAAILSRYVQPWNRSKKPICHFVVHWFPSCIKVANSLNLDSFYQSSFLWRWNTFRAKPRGYAADAFIPGPPCLSCW